MAYDYAGQVERLEAELRALESIRYEIDTSEAIKDTRLSKLFHVARTTSPKNWESAHAFITIEGGEATVESVDTLADGYWSPETRRRYDAILSVPVKPFMNSGLFRRLVKDDIQQQMLGVRSNLDHYRKMERQQRKQEGEN